MARAPAPPSRQEKGDDERLMRIALRLAARARGRTAPNPMVGAVVVKDGRILARGYHRKAGLDHAEVAALRRLRPGQAAGAVLYTTLEPCNHVGRTGPCTEAIIQAGIRRVVVGSLDPNPKVNGSGVERLRSAGIEVVTGVLEAECRRLNEAFAKHVRKGQPFVILKAAVSLDGRLAAEGGDARWISGEASRLEAHRLRDQADAVMVGAGTVLRDDPALTTRLPPPGGRDALRVVLDGRLRTPPAAQLLRTGSTPPLVIGEKGAASPRRVAALERAGAEVVLLPGREGRIPLGEVLALLGRRGVVTLLVEGGSELFGQLWAGRHVDRVVLFLAPVMLGRNGVPLLGCDGPDRVADAVRLGQVEQVRLGDDVCVTGVPDFAVAVRSRSRARAAG